MSRRKSQISNDFVARLRLFMDMLGYKHRQDSKFAKDIGVTPSFLSDVLNQKSGPSFSMLLGISNKYPKTDIHWLLTGKHSGDSLDNPEINNVIEIQHAELVRKFKNKQLAKSVNFDLVELEELSPATFKETCAYVKGLVSGLKKSIEDVQSKHSRPGLLGNKKPEKNQGSI